jgi:hypothetical protein
VSSSPDSGEVLVTGVSEICIQFSERMGKRTVRDVIVVRPHVQVREGRWSGNTFCLVLDDSLQSSVTYTVLVMGGCKDSHGNHMTSPHLAAFSTGDTLLAGSIRGSVLAKGLPASGIPVWAYDSLRCPEPDFAKDEPHYVSQSGAAGDYKFIGLPSGTYLLYAFKDKDANRAYDEETDFVSGAPAPIRVTPDTLDMLDVEIALVDPNEPGRVAGTVEHCLPETVQVIVYAVSTEDSASFYSGPMMRDSTFAVDGLPPGRYSLCCYADLNSNETHDVPEEPSCADAHFVGIVPGETLKDVTLVIACPEERPAPEEGGGTGEKEEETPPRGDKTDESDRERSPDESPPEARNQRDETIDEEKRE